MLPPSACAARPFDAIEDSVNSIVPFTLVSGALLEPGTMPFPANSKLPATCPFSSIASGNFRRNTSFAWPSPDQPSVAPSMNPRTGLAAMNLR